MQTEGGPVVATENLTRNFGARRAVDDVSIAVGAGEALAIFGPYGAGKTTLLRMLGGILRGRPVGGAGAWLKFLVAFDLVFIVACSLAYPFTIEE